MGASTWASRPHDTGEPISLEMSSDISCIWLRTASAARASTAPRSVGDMCGHGPWSTASRAAATARSMSAFMASGVLPTSSPVDGECTSKTDEEDGWTHSPPMNRRSYDFMGPPWTATDACVDCSPTRTRSGPRRTAAGSDRSPVNADPAKDPTTDPPLILPWIRRCPPGGVTLRPTRLTRPSPGADTGCDRRSGVRRALPPR